MTKSKQARMGMSFTQVESSLGLIVGRTVLPSACAAGASDLHATPNRTRTARKAAGRLGRRASSGLPFAGRLAIPQDFEKREVAEIKKKEKENEQGACPHRRFWRGDRQTSEGQSSAKTYHQSDEKLNQGVPCQGQKAAADSGNSKVERGLLRSFNGKLVGKAI